MRFIALKSASLMFLWQMKFPNTQTPCSILTLSRKKTNIPSSLMLKINEENISRYQLRPIMKNNLKSFFYTGHDLIDFIIPQIQLDLSNAFPRDFGPMFFLSVHREMIPRIKKQLFSFILLNVSTSTYLQKFNKEFLLKLQ